MNQYTYVFTAYYEPPAICTCCAGYGGEWLYSFSHILKNGEKYKSSFPWLRWTQTDETGVYINVWEHVFQREYEDWEIGDRVRYIEGLLDDVGVSVQIDYL